MTMQSTSFWDFSNQIYDFEEVAQLCLQLQDEYQLDVNLILFCYWSAHFDREVSNEAWQKILEFSFQWKSQLVQPLREVRRWMKTEIQQHQQNSQFSILRDRIKMDELAAEKYQQEFIENCVPELVAKKMQFNGKRANDNVRILLQATGIESHEEIKSKLRLLEKAILNYSKE